MIRLQFSLERAVTSNLIAWFDAGHFSHVDCLLADGRLLGARSDAAGASTAGVQIRPAKYADWVRRALFTIPATRVQSRKFHAFLHEQIGKPYDSTAIWAFVMGRNWRETDSWICSELQAAALEASGVVPELYLAANKIRPVSLALAVSAIGCKVREWR